MRFNPLIPELKVSHFEMSLSFYTQVLGFRIDFERPEYQFAFLSYQGSQLMIEQENPTWQTGRLEYPYGRGINLAMLVEDIDVRLQSLREQSNPLLVETQERWYRQDQVLVGRRQFLVMDPDGYVLRFAQSLGEKQLPSLPEEQA